MRVFSTAMLVAGLFAAPVQAASVWLDVTVTFQAEKTAHDCVDGLFGQEQRADGTCGAYQSVDLGDPVAAWLSFSGMFKPMDEGGYMLGGGDLDSISCSIGGAACLVSTLAEARVSADAVSLRPFGLFNSRFDFDLAADRGQHVWVDDGFPFFGKGSFALTDMTVSGLDVPDAVVPLPAGLVLLGSGLAALVVMRRRRI